MVQDARLNGESLNIRICRPSSAYRRRHTKVHNCSRTGVANGQGSFSYLILSVLNSYLNIFLSSLFRIPQFLPLFYAFVLPSFPPFIPHQLYLPHSISFHSTRAYFSSIPPLPVIPPPFLSVIPACFLLSLPLIFYQSMHFSPSFFIPLPRPISVLDSAFFPHNSPIHLFSSFTLLPLSIIQTYLPFSTSSRIPSSYILSILSPLLPLSYLFHSSICPHSSGSPSIPSLALLLSHPLRLFLCPFLSLIPSITPPC